MKRIGHVFAAAVALAFMNYPVLAQDTTLTITGSGNVGIGTTSPSERLDVVGNIEVNGFYKYAGGQQFIGFHNSGGQEHLTLNAGGAEYIAIKDGVGILLQSGDVGIGTANPAQRLDVAGTVQMSGFKLPTNANNGYVLTSDTSGVGTWQQTSGGLPSGTSGQTLRHDGANWVANSLLFNNGSNIGIGTTTPGAMLHLLDGTSIFTYGTNAPHLSEAGVSIGTAFNAHHGLAIRTSNNLIGDPDHASLWIENVGMGGHTFYAADQGGDATPFVITMDGDVGIGTATPAQKLDVVGTVQMSGFKLPASAQDGYVLTSDSFGVGTWQQISGGLPSGTSGQTLRHDGANWVASSLLFNDGTNIGIGTTTPGAVLHLLNGTSIFAYGNGAQYLSEAGVSVGTAFNARHGLAIRTSNNLIGDPNHASLWIENVGMGGHTFYAADQAGDTTPFVITMDGDVGIGTAAPDQLLSVNGNASKVGGGSWATFSDRRLKQDINTFSDGLSVIRGIHPVTFRYNGKLGYPTDKMYVGVIAQDIQSIAPYTVDAYRAKLDPEDGEGTDILRFDSSALIYVAINAINELDTKVAEVQELRRENQALSARLTKLESLVKSFAESKGDVDGKLIGELGGGSSSNPE